MSEERAIIVIVDSEVAAAALRMADPCAQVLVASEMTMRIDRQVVLLVDDSERMVPDALTLHGVIELKTVDRDWLDFKISPMLEPRRQVWEPPPRRDWQMRDRRPRRRRRR